MTATVQSDIAVMVKDQIKRKREENKLRASERQVQNYMDEIAKTQRHIDEKKQELVKRAEQLQSHKKFTRFLEQVVQQQAIADSIEAWEKKPSDKGDKQTEKNNYEYEINWLRNRFINLKQMKKKFKEQKLKIAEDMAKAHEDERRQSDEMTKQMYSLSKEYQRLQTRIEQINEVNSKLESEFEHQITVQNRAKQEAH